MSLSNLSKNHIDVCYVQKYTDIQSSEIGSTAPVWQ